MAMVLFYNRINWENFPSIVTPINEINLNKVDYAVKTLDERTVELYNTKAEKSVVLNTIKDWSMDEKTGIITITKVNGDVVKFDLNIEKIPVNFELSEDGILTMTTDDGSVFTANIGAMIPVIVFENSDTVSVAKISNRTEIATDFSEYEHEFDEPFTGKIVVQVVPREPMAGPVNQYSATFVNTSGLSLPSVGAGTTEEEFSFSVEDIVKITVKTMSENNIVALYTETETNEIRYRFDVKEGSINDKHLEPNYLAAIKVQAENAELSATASEESAKEAAKSAEEAKGYAEQAKEVIFPVSDVALNRQTLGYMKKNLLKNTAVTTTSNGVTFTVNDDGSVTVNGTATANVDFRINTFDFKAKVKYILSGCPSGGSNATYYVELGNETYREYGKGVVITQSENKTIPVIIRIVNGQTVSNLTFYPMIRSADIIDDTFEPYIDDVDTRLKALTPVNNLLATVPGSSLDATMGKMLNDMIVALKDSFVVYPVSLINGWTGELVVAANVLSRQATISGYIDGTNATDVVFAKGRSSINELASNLCNMPVPVQTTAFTAIDFDTSIHRITFSGTNDGFNVKAPSTGKIYQFNASVVVAHD